MKTISLINKSLREQIRSYWVILLTLSMGPFFIFVYFLITETSKPQYTLIIVNNDKGIYANDQQKNYGVALLDYFKGFKADSIAIPFMVREAENREEGINSLKNKKSDALLIIHDSFSQGIENHKLNDSTIMPKIEFIGDVTNPNYLISAVFANEIINRYALEVAHRKQIIEVSETPLGMSAVVSNFDMIVPGILIVSIIMLMFTASIAFVSEVENKTMIRLKLSKLTAFDFLAGISIVQLSVGIISVVLTLITAIMLGFQYTGSVLIMLLIAGLTSLSVISFSLIIAAVTKSANEVLIVGNFPMFLFMFFTGAAFPLKSDALFTIAEYPVNIQGLMTPTHAISALNKTLIMDMGVVNIIPEILSIIILTIIYFIIGGVIFKYRHLKLT